MICQNELTVFSGFTNTQYNPAWIHEEIAYQLERIEKGEIKRLMLFIPPRHGKSELGSINFPAWYLGRHPEQEIIVSSYSAELAQDFGYKTRNLVNSREYQEIFRTKLRDDSKSKAKWLTNEGGGYTAVGVGGAITGRGADILLIDDPFKNREEAESKVIRDKVWNWYTSTAYTRLEKDAKVILIMTRWHKDDLAGRLLEAEKNGGEHWEVVKFPAIATRDEKNRVKGDALWPEKYDIQALMNIKRTIGSYDWGSLYLQEPMTSETQEFKKEWFKYIHTDDVVRMETRNFLTIDTAVSQRDSADNTGATLNFVSKDNKWYLKTYKLKVNPTDLFDFIFKMCTDYKIELVGIEDTIYLLAIKPFLDQEMRKRNKFITIKPLKHKSVAKETRIRGLIPRYEAGQIFHIKGECNDLEDEMMDFPKGIHDDVLDSLAYQVQVASKPFEKEEYVQPDYEGHSEYELQTRNNTLQNKIDEFSPNYRQVYEQPEWES